MHNSAAELQFLLNTTGPREREPRSRSQVGRIPRVTEVMALAIHFQDMIRRGEARDYADLARLGCLTRERMSQIMELIWLAPDIQQAIIEFPPTSIPRFPINEVAVRRIAAELDWSEQRELWRKLKQDKHLDWDSSRVKSLSTEIYRILRHQINRLQKYRISPFVRHDSLAFSEAKWALGFQSAGEKIGGPAALKPGMPGPFATQEGPQCRASSILFPFFAMSQRDSFRSSFPPYPPLTGSIGLR